MKILSFVLLEVLKLQLTGSQGTTGGPSSFGYDAASACSRPYSRLGRARIEKLPCDFRRQNWCAVAGNAYPWHAVRRFVQENQGLMRRMYGDERHLDVIRNELEKNDVDVELEDGYTDFLDESRRFRYEYELDFEDRQSRVQIEPRSDGRGFTSRAWNGARRFGKVPKSNENSRIPSETSLDQDVVLTPSTVSQHTTTTTTMPTSGIESTVPTMRTSIAENSTSRSDILSSLSPNETSQSVWNSSETSTTPMQNFSLNEILSQSERLNQSIEFSTEVPLIFEEIIEVSEIAEATSTSTTSTANPRTRTSGTSSLDGRNETVFVGDELERNKNPKEPPTGVGDQDSGERTREEEQVQQQKQQHFRPRPEYRPSETTSENSNMEGQLFQDVAAKDQEPVLKLRGVNACPVKEEVVAPFWANNTRGEVLALLNLYPFEQYIHWEKCTNENKQMYCRNGCRCEQQFRLHRLLAYDPNNECRGIFSDWFKFPSCCVCRCYDLPVEFRVTSRSPRIQKQKRRRRQRADVPRSG
ncbi:protein spaetzle 4 [Orussus abietinus]|uniref:protein spaetzle 4 n=1 Tax=Orussus abietinus TaxID=222816 RepID=UPI000C7161D5|nr:protein spaetzle 4 [Orussus abietinus]